MLIYDAGFGPDAESFVRPKATEVCQSQQFPFAVKGHNNYSCFVAPLEGLLAIAPMKNPCATIIGKNFVERSAASAFAVNRQSLRNFFWSLGLTVSFVL
jgi:hypothetical protein